MNQISSTRQLHYDLLRIFASFMVVMLHVSAFYWDKIQPQTEQWMALNLFDSAVRSCVPLFFMLSGAFLLAKELPLNKLLGKNVLHLAVVWLVWSVLYAVDAIGLPAFFHADAGQIFTAVVNGKYHLWFLPKMIEVYLMVPLLYAGTRMKEGKGLYYLLVLFGLFGILKSTLTAGIFYGYFCLPVCLEAICLFLLFKNIGAERVQGRWSGRVAFVSKATMGIYLLHPFVLERLDRAGINSLTWNTWCAVPLVTLLTFSVCLGISTVLLKLPLVKKML